MRRVYVGLAVTYPCHPSPSDVYLWDLQSVKPLVAARVYIISKKSLGTPGVKLRT